MAKKRATRRDAGSAKPKQLRKRLRKAEDQLQDAQTKRDRAQARVDALSIIADEIRAQLAEIEQAGKDAKPGPDEPEASADAQPKVAAKPRRASAGPKAVAKPKPATKPRASAAKEAPAAAPATEASTTP